MRRNVDGGDEGEVHYSWRIRLLVTLLGSFLLPKTKSTASWFKEIMFHALVAFSDLLLGMFALDVICRIFFWMVRIVIVLPAKLIFYVISSILRWPARVVCWIFRLRSTSSYTFTSPEGLDIPEPYDTILQRAMFEAAQTPPNMVELITATYNLDLADQLRVAQVVKRISEMRAAGYRDRTEILPEDSISNMGDERQPAAPVSSSQLSAVAESTSSVSRASLFSTSSPEERCFIAGTFLQDVHGVLVPVEHLSQFDVICAHDKRPLRITRMSEHEGPHNVVSFQAGDARLCVTPSHRVMVLRGGEQVSAPASSLRVGDDVVCGEGVRRLVESPITSIMDISAFELAFDPDAAVETFCDIQSVLTMGRHPPRARRHGRHTDRLSFPDTEDSWA